MIPMRRLSPRPYMFSLTILLSLKLLAQTMRDKLEKVEREQDEKPDWPIARVYIGNGGLRSLILKSANIHT
jgi:hypothetical protein